MSNKQDEIEYTHLVIWNDGLDNGWQLSESPEAAIEYIESLLESPDLILEGISLFEVNQLRLKAVKVVRSVCIDED